MMGAAEATAAHAADTATPTFIKVTEIAPVGEYRVGVIGIYGGPLHARTKVAGSTAGTLWESTHLLRNGQELAVGDALYICSVLPNSPGIIGGIGLHPVPSDPAIIPGSVLLDSDGQIRFDGPDVNTATDMRSVAWQPDETHPSQVKAGWWPALSVNRDTGAPVDPHMQTLEVGSEVSVGTAELKVSAIQGATSSHPARLILTLMP